PRSDHRARQLLRHPRQPRGADRAGDHAGVRVRERAVRRGARRDPRPRVRVRLRRRARARQGLRSLRAVPAEAPRMTRTRLGAHIDAWAAIRPRYVALADALRDQLAGAAARLGVPAIVQARAKSIASFAEKAARKADKYRDPVRELTDLCGARV